MAEMVQDKRRRGFFFTIFGTFLGAFAVIWMVKPEPLVSRKVSRLANPKHRRYRGRGPSMSHGIMSSHMHAIESRRGGGLTPSEEHDILNG